MNEQLTVKEIAAVLQQHQLLVACGPDAVIRHITYDSRKVTPDSLFVCKGVHFKEAYFTSAREAGFACYMAETAYDTSIPYLQVSDVKKALSVVSILFYHRPSDAFRLTGITGTAGKTTTAYMLRSILNVYAGRDTGLLSTNETYCGGEYREAENTTPESLVMQGLFAEAREHQLPFVTMEVSSQAYSVDRVYDQTFDIGIFMNIDKDHIGFPEHPTYEHYRSCKLQLVKNSRLMLVYSKTNELELIRKTAAEANVPLKLFGEAGDDYYLEHVRKLEDGFSFTACSKDGWHADMSTNADGWFNLTNATAAIAAAKEYGVDDESIRKGLASIVVPGRMNVYHDGNTRIVVDFAHNRLTLLELMKSTVRDYPGRPVKVVIGSTGKTQIRWEDIGKVCGQYATHVYLTEDDPDFEDPEKICEAIASYIPQGGPATWEIIPDRTKAIEKAFADSKDGDILLLLGKGQDHFIKYRGGHRPYESDPAIAKRCIQARHQTVR